VDLDLTCLSNVMPAAGRQVGSALYMEEEKWLVDNVVAMSTIVDW
jgi:hypothetical protein